VIYFCVPAYNEEATVGICIYKIKEVMEDIKRDYRVFVIDDGSDDGSWELLRNYEKLLPLRVVRNPERKGLGYCLEKFIEMSVGESRIPDRDIMIVIESDFTGGLNVIHEMVRGIEGGMDVMIASGLARGGEVVGAPFTVGFTKSLLHLLLRNLYGIEGVRDYLSMTRAYRVTVLKRFLGGKAGAIGTLETSAANTELLIRLSRITHRISEIPCTQRYDIRTRKSRMSLVPLFVNHIRLVMHHWSDREAQS
jgi:glycosyltransferase involved in cell wall biosynthesis